VALQPAARRQNLLSTGSRRLGTIQCVAVKSNLPEDLFEDQGSYAGILPDRRGKIRAEARAPSGYELDLESAEIVQRVPESDPYPSLPKITHRFPDGSPHLWLRSRRQHAALKVRHQVIKGLRDYFDSNGFVWWMTPSSRPRLAKAPRLCSRWLIPRNEKVYLAQSGHFTARQRRPLSARFIASAPPPGREIQNPPPFD